MKLLINSIIGAALISSASAAMSIVETENFAFKPNGSAVLNFNKFDTMSGTRTLVSVQVEVFYTKTGGRLEVDNDSATAGTIDVAHAVNANLTSAQVSLVKTGGISSVGQTGSMNAVNQALGVGIGATTGDATDTFNQTNTTDYYDFVPSATNASDSQPSHRTA